MIGGVALRDPPSVRGRAMQVDDYAEQSAPFEVIREALVADGVRAVEFNVEIDPTGAVTVRAVVGTEPGSAALGEVELVEGALPEPYRRRPVQPTPDHPRGPADVAKLERILRRVWPGEQGMTDAEIDAAEQRLGVAVPPEARVLYRVTRGRDQRGDVRSSSWQVPVPLDVWALDDPRRQARRTDHYQWWMLAGTAGTTAPDSAVQALSQPPEWFVLGTLDWYHIAIDLVPGPAGKVGQIIGWIDETRGDLPLGAEVLADSLLDYVRNRRSGKLRWNRPWRKLRWNLRGGKRRTQSTDDLPEYGEVTTVNGRSIEDVISPELEVLYLVRNRNNRVSIAPAAGLPRLRTLYATPAAIADPLEIGKLGKLEYLRTGVDEWRALLDAGAVPRSLLACEVDTGFGDRADVHHVADLVNRIRELWGLQPSERTVTARAHPGPPPTRP